MHTVHCPASYRPLCHFSSRFRLKTATSIIQLHALFPLRTSIFNILINQIAHTRLPRTHEVARTVQGQIPCGRGLYLSRILSPWAVIHHKGKRITLAADFVVPKLDLFKFDAACIGDAMRASYGVYFLITLLHFQHCCRRMHMATAHNFSLPIYYSNSWFRTHNPASSSTHHCIYHRPGIHVPLPRPAPGFGAFVTQPRHHALENWLTVCAVVPRHISTGWGPRLLFTCHSRNVARYCLWSLHAAVLLLNP